MRIIVCKDGSFANSRDVGSQLGFVVPIADAKGQCNILHYSSSKYKRVTRTVISAETHALVLLFDHAFVVRDMVSEMVNHDVSLEAYVHSKTFFEVLAKQGNTFEKRLQINVNGLQESNYSGDLSNVQWIPGHSNPANSLT